MFFFSRSAVDILMSHHHGKHLLASASSHELHEYECMLDPMMIWSVAKTCRERDCNRYELILLVRDSRQWLTDCCASKQGPISTWPLSTMEKTLFFHSQHALYTFEVPSLFHYTGAATVHEVTVKLLVILRCMRIALCIHCRCKHMALLS